MKINYLFNILNFLFLILIFSSCTQKQPAITEKAVNTQASFQPSGELINKSFTLEELAKYNGQNGKPAYVAVDGIVFDVSDIFINGQHQKHLAGKELTKEFYTQHEKKQIEKYKAVGKLVK